MVRLTLYENLDNGAENLRLYLVSFGWTCNNCGNDLDGWSRKASPGSCMLGWYLGKGWDGMDV
jgi:hypothetical protein